MAMPPETPPPCSAKLVIARRSRPRAPPCLRRVAAVELRDDGDRLLLVRPVDLHPHRGADRRREHQERHDAAGARAPPAADERDVAAEARRPVDDPRGHAGVEPERMAHLDFAGLHGSPPCRFESPPARPRRTAFGYGARPRRVGSPVRRIARRNPVPPLPPSLAPWQALIALRRSSRRSGPRARPSPRPRRDRRSRGSPSPPCPPPASSRP